MDACTDDHLRRTAAQISQHRCNYCSEVFQRHTVPACDLNVNGQFTPTTSTQLNCRLQLAKKERSNREIWQRGTRSEVKQKGNVCWVKLTDFAVLGAFIFVGLYLNDCQSLWHVLYNTAVLCYFANIFITERVSKFTQC